MQETLPTVRIVVNLSIIEKDEHCESEFHVEFNAPPEPVKISMAVSGADMHPPTKFALVNVCTRTEGDKDALPIGNTKLE